MKKILFLLFILVLAGTLVSFFQSRFQTSPPVVSPSAEEPSPTLIPVAEEKEGIQSLKSFTIEGANFSFSLSEMRVKQGERVKITFVNKSGFHDWKLDEFAISTKQVPAGQQETVEFVADKKGTFEYYCSVGNHRAQGMVGKLIVE